jgi:hypothetical protein
MNDKFDKAELAIDQLSAVSGGSRNSENPIVQTVMIAFEKAVKAAQQEAIRANGPLGSTFPGHF